MRTKIDLEYSVSLWLFTHVSSLFWLAKPAELLELLEKVFHLAEVGGGGGGGYNGNMQKRQRQKQINDYREELPQTIRQILG